jgi:hypothetical protein
VSQQPYQPGQQPGGYQQPAQQGYPQGGYQQPAQAPGYGNYPGAPGGSPQYGGANRGGGLNALANPSLVSQILLIASAVVAVLGVIGSFFAFSGYGDGSGKFYYFAAGIVTSLGFAGVLLALSVLVKRKDA